MARAKRVQHTGYHYITNYSVELRSVFIVKKDYMKFIDLCTELSVSHEFNLHAFSLVPNAYYLLIETKKENLSVIVKLLSGRYSFYFNQEYGRKGHLWEGRYKSTFIDDVNYTYYFIRYMEHVPKMMGITSHLSNHDYSSYRQFVGLDTCMLSLRSSIMFKRFNSIDEIKRFLEKEINKESIENIIKILSNKEVKPTPVKEVLSLSGYFKENQSKQERLESIIKAYKNGVSQKKIANYLELSQQAISLRLKRHKEKNIDQFL